MAVVSMHYINNFSCVIWTDLKKVLNDLQFVSFICFWHPSIPVFLETGFYFCKRFCLFFLCTCWELYALCLLQYDQLYPCWLLKINYQSTPHPPQTQTLCITQTLQETNALRHMSSTQMFWHTHILQHTLTLTNIPLPLLTHTHPPSVNWCNLTGCCGTLHTQKVWLSTKGARLVGTVYVSIETTTVSCRWVWPAAC